jgi:hypothetical protein
MKSELLEIVNGTLLGDGYIKFDTYGNKKYYSFKLTAKDINFLKWVKKKFEKYKLNCWITYDSKSSDVHSLYFYINSAKYFREELLSLRNKWYKEIKGKTIKAVPRDLELTPTTLLFWYLGDGSLIRRRNDETRVPHITFATNGFLKKDVEFLKKKLKEIG